MSKYRLLMLALVCQSTITQAQTIKNGSFEPVHAPKACDYVYNNRFSYTMGTIYAFGNTAIGGTVGKIYLQNDSCNDKSAKEGKYFVGLSSNDKQADAIAMALTTPLVANKNYTVQFYNRKGSLLVPIGLEVGYSNDTASFGTLIGTSPAPTDTNWTLQTFTFKPTMAASYITLRGVMTTVIGYSMTPVDAFSLRFAAGTEDVSTSYVPAPYPNPFKETSVLTLDEELSFPCTVRIIDLAGRVTREIKNVNERKVLLERNNMPAGTYMLQVEDKEHQQYFTKLVAI